MKTIKFWCLLGLVAILGACATAPPEGLQMIRTSRGLLVTLEEAVYFQLNEDQLMPQANEKLAQLVRFILAHDKQQILVEGHTDDTGGEEYNLKLSERRANAVMDALVARGVDAGLISVQGYGETLPITDNETDAGRQKNRRVEVLILD